MPDLAIDGVGQLLEVVTGTRGTCAIRAGAWPNTPRVEAVFRGLTQRKAAMSGQRADQQMELSIDSCQSMQRPVVSNHMRARFKNARAHDRTNK